jgi:hypothetical protein
MSLVISYKLRKVTGSDNTSTTLSLAFYYMLTSPHGYYKKLQKELDSAFPNRNCTLDWDVLAGLPFLNAAINEALRLASPYYLPRIVPRGGVLIDGQDIPVGTTVALAAYSQQTSSENFYPDPLVNSPAPLSSSFSRFSGLPCRKMAFRRTRTRIQNRESRTAFIFIWCAHSLSQI